MATATDQWNDTGSPRRRSWQCPAYGSNKLDIRTWVMQNVADGRAYKEASPGFNQLEESIRILSGRPSEDLAVKQRDGRFSKVQTARAKRNLREMTNALSDIRYAPGFHADNNEVQQTAATLNKCGAFWYADTFADIKIKRAVQWMAISPAGWIEIAYTQDPGRRGRREIELIPHSDFDIVMTGIPEDGDHQKAYTVTIIRDWPVYYAHAKWPEWQAQLKPDRETPRGWMDKIKERATEIVSDVFGTGEPSKATARNPTCRLYYQFVLDLSINETQHEMRMGYVTREVPDPTDPTGKAKVKREFETPWSYTVPYKGQPIPTGVYSRDPATGQEIPVTRPADPDDCRIFPGRRLIVVADSVANEPIYDGAFWDWHGQVPLVKFVADSWPFGEFSMLHDVVPMHETINEIDRITHQTVRNRFDPTMLYNLKALTREKAKALRSDIQGQRVGYNGTEAQGENVVRPLMPASFNTIEEWIEKYKAYLVGEMDYEMGVHEAANLTKLKLGANEDSLEKALTMVGVIAKGIARDMERSMRDLADMWKYLVFQYWTTPKIMRITGVDGMAPENFDFEPGNMIPSHLPGERPDRPSVYSRMKRAHWMAEHCPFLVTPNSLHDFVTAAMKLTYLQLSRQGFPISPYTLAEVFRIPNFGKVPEGADTELDKWMAFQRVMLEFKASLSKEARELSEEQGIGDDPNAPATGPKGGQKGTGGRAPSNTASPKLQQKGDGRPVNRSSP